eukprot:Seg1936.6 transcript_id=Seg1936.6/GoldUCD/mRNA.D3Y31 product="hypothetical protein" protein_id=Seg1936.6/GoldUCD/D3Y31
MAARALTVRNDSWKENEDLRKDLEQYISQGLHRQEVLDFMKRDYEQYAWSLRSLDRRCSHFGIRRHNKDVSVDELRVAVQRELDGPGKLLGYRALHGKIRQVHKLNVPRDAVYDMMYDLDPDGLKNRALTNKRRKRVKGAFVTRGPNWIERWWRELHERLELYFKEQLQYLKEHMFYNPQNEIDRNLLSYIYIPVLQKELDTFRETIWNNHRIRKQRETNLPSGVPNHIYSFPEEYGLENCGYQVTENMLRKVAEVSRVLEVDDDYIDVNFREQCKQIIEKPEEIESKNCVNAFIYLKETYNQLNTQNS